MSNSRINNIWNIPGGVHPASHKALTREQPVRFAGVPDQLIFPLTQYIGPPAEPIVAIGQTVLKGQIIAKAKDVISVPIHASTSGRIVAIKDHPIAHPSGMSAPCIVIQSDGLDQWIEHRGIDDHHTLNPSALLRTIGELGISGMGGAGFPTEVKLSIRAAQHVETLIINGAECEPYITADERLMRECSTEVIQGIGILNHILQPSKRTIIGVEDDKPQAIAALRTAAQGTPIEVVSFPTKYPSGGEKQIIQILTGKEVPSPGLPIDIGIICQNIGTAIAIYRAVCHGKPLISRIVTVTGHACQQPSNLEVLIGTPVDYLLENCQFQEDQCERLIMGGPMMGFTLNHTHVPVLKTTNCLLAASKQAMPPPPPAQPCIRCGLCAEACPASLLPQQLYWFARGKAYDKLEEHRLIDCIECGACSYVCPSHIPLVQYYRASKATIRKQKHEHTAAEHAKMRFEARQARLEQEAAEKRARREARQRAATDAKKRDIVQAAVARTQAKKNHQPNLS